MTTAIREKLSRISAATIDRLLRTTKRKMRIKGTGGTRPAAGLLKNLIPILNHFECKEHGAGLWQIDLVQHDGDCPEGESCYTLTVTEIAPCRTVHYALKNKAFTWVFQALNDARSPLSLPVRIPHSDNGSEFINHALKRWRRQNGIELTRSRSDKKNDNCRVEQKNYASVRKIVGYGRYSGEKDAAALDAVYGAYDDLLNYFYPCRKLLSKERAGSKVKKNYDQPKTPFDRAVSGGGLPQKIKDTLSVSKAAINLMETSNFTFSHLRHE
jgi:hypothetical protein